MSAEATNDNLPRRLGRYDVVLPLTTGPTSSLFVGRSAEPGSAPSSVTIKRIAPALTHERDVESFLLKARKALAVRHPNVIEIRELRNEADELFIVMEYVEGEPVTAVIHRLEVEERTLDFGLAAYIVAEAAAGLDAGHELGVLHEHVTPHDVFVCYDGSVKVLDLGVAHPLELMLGTTTVTARDLPYASPERCKGDALDRRSDIFSLGAILWELMTGVSPFERTSEAETLRAILSAEPIVPPPRVLRSLPTRLSEIAMRALARDPATRYATARAFRHELRTFLRGHSPGRSPSEELGKLMQALFAKRIKNNARILRRFDSSRGSDPAIVTNFSAPPSATSSAATSSAATSSAAPPSAAPPSATWSAAPPSATSSAAPPSAAPEPNRPTTEVSRLAPSTVEPDQTPSGAERAMTPMEIPTREIVLAPSVEVPPAPFVVASPPPPPPTPFESASAADAPAYEPPLTTPRVTPRRGLVAALVGIGLALALVGFVGMARRKSVAPVSEVETDSLVAQSRGATQRSSAPSPTPSTPSAVTEPSTGVAADEQTVLGIETLPPRATIAIGGAVMGVTPLELRLRKSREPVTVEIRHAGYQTLRERVVPDVDQRLRLSLVLMPRAATAPSAGPYHRFE